MTNQSMMNPQGFQPQPQMGMQQQQQNSYQTNPVGQQFLAEAFGVSPGNKASYSTGAQQNNMQQNNNNMGFNQNTFST